MKHYALTMLLTGAGLLTACGGANFALNEWETDSAAPDSDPALASVTEEADPGSFELPDLNSFTAKTLDGDIFTNADFAEADVTVINIWSTTCGPCIREMPELAAFANSLPENVRVMTWCLDAEYSPDAGKISGFLEDCDFRGVTLVSGDGDLQSLYGSLMYTPTTIFLDHSGNMLVEPIIGAVDIQTEYKDRINNALDFLGKDHIA